MNLNLFRTFNNLIHTIMKKYLIALPCFRGAKGFCHRTILVSAKNKIDAISQAKRLRPGDNIGDVKEVFY